jgi:hypothetical protein
VEQTEPEVVNAEPAAEEPEPEVKEAEPAAEAGASEVDQVAEALEKVGVSGAFLAKSIPVPQHPDARVLRGSGGFPARALSASPHLPTTILISKLRRPCVCFRPTKESFALFQYHPPHHHPPRSLVNRAERSREA